MQKFDEKIDEVKKLYEETGQTHHLVRLRNLRVKFGHRISMRPRTDVSPKIKPAKNPFPDIVNDIPELDYKDVTPKILRGAIQHQGALIARNFLSDEDIVSLREGIDKTFDESTKYFSDDPKIIQTRDKKSPWFRLDLPIKGVFDKGSVGFMHRTGSVWTFLSPFVVHRLLNAFEDAGLLPTLDEYFEGRTCLSFNKSVLRRLDPLKRPADWHQDGAFMTEDIKSVNLWIALSDCGAGTDCPGMDFVPKRLNEIVPTGTNKAAHGWSVSPESVDEWFKDCPPVTPTYKAGDGIFFDHYNLHATSYSPDYTKTRYALETWFFAEEFAAHNQKPTYW